MAAQLIKTNTEKHVPDELKCCYCNLFLSCGPVRCNSEGKGICGRCMPKKEDSGIVVRNLSYEAAVMNTKFPCIFHKYGCRYMLLFNTVVFHENNCPYKPISCISLELCQWKGPIRSIFDHFTSEHKDLILKNNTYKIEVKKDLFINMLTKVDELTVLFYFVYFATEKSLYVEGVHFSGQNVEVSSKITLINSVDSDFLLGLKPFKCGLFISKKVNFKKAQKISVADFLPALQNPDAIVVKITTAVNRKYDFVSCIDEVSMEQLKCSKCFIYMVPPIVTYQGKNYCQNCYPSGSPDKKLEMFAKQAQYPCRWNKCPFVGTYDIIRLHETDCEYASIDCPLSCELLVTRNTAVEHLENHHSCIWFHDKVALDYSPNGSTNKYYCSIGNQVIILYLYRTSGIYFHILLPLNNSDFVIKYYFCHSHCKLTTSTVCITQNLKQNNYIKIEAPNMPPCFNSKNYLIKIKIQKPKC